MQVYSYLTFICLFSQHFWVVYSFLLGVFYFWWPHIIQFRTSLNWNGSLFCNWTVFVFATCSVGEDCSALFCFVFKKFIWIMIFKSVLFSSVLFETLNINNNLYSNTVKCRQLTHRRNLFLLWNTKCTSRFARAKKIIEFDSLRQKHDNVFQWQRHRANRLRQIRNVNQATYIIFARVHAICRQIVTLSI